MTKILFFIPTLGHGGEEKVLVNLVNNMDKSKLEKIGEKYPVIISITDDFSFFIDGKENSCLYKFFNYNLLSTNNNFDFSYINGNIDFNCSIFLSKEIMDNNGLCIGDDVSHLCYRDYLLGGAEPKCTMKGIGK